LINDFRLRLVAAVEVTEERVMFARGRDWLEPVRQTCCVHVRRLGHMINRLDVMSCTYTASRTHRVVVRPPVGPSSVVLSDLSAIDATRRVQSQLTRRQVDPAARQVLVRRDDVLRGALKPLAFGRVESRSGLRWSSSCACGIARRIGRRLGGQKNSGVVGGGSRAV